MSNLKYKKKFTWKKISCWAQWYVKVRAEHCSLKICILENFFFNKICFKYSYANPLSITKDSENLFWIRRLTPPSPWFDSSRAYAPYTSWLDTPHYLIFTCENSNISLSQDFNTALLVNDDRENFVSHW